MSSSRHLENSHKKLGAHGIELTSYFRLLLHVQDSALVARKGFCPAVIEVLANLNGFYTKLAVELIVTHGSVPVDKREPVHGVSHPGLDMQLVGSRPLPVIVHYILFVRLLIRLLIGQVFIRIVYIIFE